MQQYLLQLLEYNFWANDQFIIRLKDKEPLPLKIDELMGHILQAHKIWLARITSNPSPPKPWDKLEAELWEERNLELYTETTDLVKSQDLKRKVSYTNSRGEYFTNELGEVLLHIVNHSTHHRAQVALLMRQNDILPPASDLIFYLRN